MENDKKKFSEKDIAFMREDLANDMGLSKFIQATRDRFKEAGRDFDEEFKEWKEENHE